MIWVKVSPKTPVWKHYSDFLPKNAEPNGHFKRSKGLIVFKNVGILHSSQTNHIIHAGTIFHTVDRCFPNQFLQAKRRELTVFGITPIESQTPQKLHSIRHEKNYSEVEDVPQILHHNNNISNTY